MIVGESFVIPAAFLLQFKISYKNTPPIWLLKDKSGTIPTAQQEFVPHLESFHVVKNGKTPVTQTF